MIGSIYIGMSGMDAYSKGLQTISNNVSNLNSSGYKSTSVSFTDIFLDGGGGLTYGAGNDLQQSGGGVRYGGQQIDFTQGDLRQTGGDLDLAIQGDGFLVVSRDDKLYYARTGQFTVDKDGYISEENGDYRLNVLDAANVPTTVNIDDKRTSAPAATTKVTFADNISSTATEASVSNIAIYDSGGGKHVWTVKFTAAGSTSPGEWAIAVTDQGGTEVGSGVLKFIGSSIDPSTAQLTITSSPTGADPLSVVLDFSSVTSFSSATTSTIRASDVDGNATGTLSGVSIDENGMLKLTYTNSKTEILGAVAIADFRDPQELVRVGNGLFEDKGDGQRRLLASGVDGVGTLVSKQLEASNVNLSQEFGNLILIQRGFQASSQVVSIANDMIQQLFGIRGQG